jgi:hypothetical protein
MMEDLSLHILDIAENSVAAGASRVLIAVEEDEGRDFMSLLVEDDGRGMSEEEKRRALDPFFTTKGKKTGLGLPLLAQTAEQCGGALAIEPAPGGGTRVTARFRFSHFDRPPLTKMAETLMTLVFGHPEVKVQYLHRRNGRDFRWTSPPSPGGTGMLDPEAVLRARRTLKTGLSRIGAS